MAVVACEEQEGGNVCLISKKNQKVPREKLPLSLGGEVKSQEVASGNASVSTKKVETTKKKGRNGMQSDVVLKKK